MIILNRSCHAAYLPVCQHRWATQRMSKMRPTPGQLGSRGGS
jgi:hypothetical protein